MTAKDTIAAEMAFMFGERNEGRSTIDYPLEGSKAIVDALLRGIQKNGGRLSLRTPVQEILVEGSCLTSVQTSSSFCRTITQDVISVLSQRSKQPVDKQRSTHI